MSAAYQMAPCRKCGTYAQVEPLHGEKGGPLLCISCCVDFHRRIAAQRKESQRFVDGLLGRRAAKPGELHLELLEDAIRLTHPDRHPPERMALATRVTAELLALKPFVKPAVPDAPAPASEVDVLGVVRIGGKVRDTSKTDHAVNVSEASRYPCETCSLTTPWHYCSACEARWSADCKARRDRENTKQREYRARRRSRRLFLRAPVRCGACGAGFKGRREDAKYCSHACRQRAYREASP